jgi:microcystin-dependent protein
MDVTVRAAPTPGTAQPGNLYADLQSRTLWLGVDPAVDEAQAVLISDIVTLQAEIDQTLVDAKLYTDQKVAPKANIASPSFTGTPLAPTPAAADNSTKLATTAWVRTYVGTAQATEIKPGSVIMYAGSLADVGVGDFVGWLTCDGRSLLRATYPALFAKIGIIHGSVDATHFNLPNLSDRFVYGAGPGKAVGAKNTISSFLTDTQGGHIHTVSATTLTISMIPAHAHTFSDSSSSTSSAGSHQHLFDEYYNVSSGTNVEFHSPGYVPASPSLATVQRATYAAGAHTHTVAVSGTTSNVGGGAAHTHTLVTNGSHQHTITSTQVRDVLPFVALAYIIKT